MSVTLSLIRFCVTANDLNRSITSDSERHAVGAGLCARPLPGIENSGFPGANLAAKAA